ncbi:MAG: hypothetical protein IT323_02565 [Anaerolineae bacterium]|nr:hypothetical protein [Anaerolineae bacterium]
MLVSTPAPARRGVQLKLTGVLLPFAAAVLVVMLFAVISRFSPTGPNNGGSGNVPPLGSAGDQAQRTTATPFPTATLIPTVPPFPTLILPPTGTPFPLTMPDPMLAPTVSSPDGLDLTASPLPPTVVPPVVTVTPMFPERTIPMNSATRDTLSFEQPLVTYRVAVEAEGWVAVAVRPHDPALDLTLSYEVAQSTPNGSGGGGATGGGSLPLDEVGLLTYAQAGDILSLSIGATNINAMGEGTFSLSVYQQEATPIGVSEPVEGALGEGQQAAIFRLETSANQLVDINVDSDGNADLYVAVIEVSGDPDVAGQLYRGPVHGCMHGEPLFCMDQDGGVRRDPELTDVTLLEGRQYLIVVRAVELTAEAGFTLTIQPR